MGERPTIVKEEKMACKIVGEVDVEQLTYRLLDQPWHDECEIILDDSPGLACDEVTIRYDGGSGRSVFLRHSCGPKQGFFWDVYGDNFQEIELAILALSCAPYPAILTGKRKEERHG